MRRFLRWSLGLALALVLLVVGAGASVALWRYYRTYDFPTPQLAVAADSALIARGQHVADLRGCTGCHNADLGGKLFFDEPWVARLSAPNLTRGRGGRGSEYSNGELARVIRHGVRRDGRTVFGMPSSTFARLADDDVDALIAFIRSRPPVDTVQPGRQIRLLGWVGLATGLYKGEAELIDHAASPPATAPQPTSGASYGEYLARSACTECHGQDLRGNQSESGPIPDLMIVSGYTPELFQRALQQGIGADGRQLRAMMPIRRFQHLTADEVSALYAYLHSFASQGLANQRPGPD